MSQINEFNKPVDSDSVTITPAVDPEAVAESRNKPISEPGHFKNDPDDATNPNEEIERYKEKLRPAPLRS